MNRTTFSTYLISLCAIAPSAFAELGSGFYFTAGIGGGWEDSSQLESFDLDYPALYQTIFVADELDDAVTHNFNESAVYGSGNNGVLAGRAALGYLWDIFEGEPTKIGGSIYTFNATLGLEAGYRLFDNIDSSLEQSVFDPVFKFDTFQTASDKISNEAIDISAVLRLPFTESNRLALLLKGGVAYNIHAIDTTIEIEADTASPPAPPIFPLNYNRTVEDTQRHEEFLPTFAGAVEYMFYDHFGISAEYNVIVGSSHDANSQLLIGNIIIRI